MPVTTRSQSRAHKMKETNINANTINKIVVNPDETKYFKIKDSFIAKIKKTLADCDSAVGKANKMRECKNVMKINSNDLPYLLKKSNLYDKNCWQKYAVTVYNKCIEFDNEYILNKGWPELDQELIREFISEYQFTKKIVTNHIKSVDINTLTKEEHKQLVTAAKKAIETAEKGRYRRRNIPVVDYTGMDTIEPESEYDGITDIWYDYSYSYDSDYESEEEEEYTRVNITSNVNAEMKKILDAEMLKILDNSKTKCEDNSDSNSNYKDYGYGEEINKALAKTFEVFRKAREEKL